MKFHDEPVAGAPLPILPGHVSPGRLERVLRAGSFTVTAELAPPDSADPDEVYARARIFDGYVDAINATDGSGANCHIRTKRTKTQSIKHVIIRFEFCRMYRAW